MLRGWVNYFAVGHWSGCLSYIKDWVEKKVRRHMLRARKRKGFGWNGGVGRGCTKPKLFNGYRVRQRESRPGVRGPISLEGKQIGERSARKPACCVRCGGGWKRGMAEMAALPRASPRPYEGRGNRERQTPRPKPARHSSTLLVWGAGDDGPITVRIAQIRPGGASGSVIFAAALYGPRPEEDAS